MKKPNLPVLAKISIPGLSSRSSRHQTPTPQVPVETQPQPVSPFEKYYRKKLLKLLKIKDLEGRTVLLVGCEKAWLLPEIAKAKPKEIFVIDSSKELIADARRALGDHPADFFVANEPNLPYPDASFDFVLVVQQLQQINSGRVLRNVMGEISRVTRQWLILVEDTDFKYIRNRSFTRRRLSYYKTRMLSHRFHLRETAYLPVETSQTVLKWLSNPGKILRWLFNPFLFILGFPWAPKPDAGDLRKVPQSVQKLVLTFSAGFDAFLLMPKGTTKMLFERERLFRRG
jgi:ubiquinone/menaquinone biosynthesis C-methylase UbiE